MFDEVCKSINAIDEFFVDDPNNLREYNSLNKLNMYFSYSNCSNDDPKLISEFIVLLSLFNGIDIGANLDSDKLVEYAILWLSYKLNQKTQNGTTKLDDFYTNNVAKNRCYDENIGTANNSKIKKDVIEKQIRSMDIDIKDISNFYDAFKSLCKNALDINKGSSYYKLLSSLSNDYKKFENKYNKHACSSISPLVAYPRSSVTKNIIITIAIIFVAASILLGVSYKYSLFGFRKRFQKQKLKEQIKK
ncbi:YIR protein [Plasmodium yoelii]|uniref:YIR protein n=1 Tax=Plasmodium yoelii TaxID=5861 RepID=A0A077X729_PLAYE|nr:YIR protein [Plasmodium yoelii]